MNSVNVHSAAADTEIFRMNEDEAKRLRRGAILPALLILPMAAMFGFDDSKSQPMHFLMIFAMASGLAAVVVSISWYGAKRRIDDFSHTTLAMAADHFTWMSSYGENKILFAEISSVSISKVRGAIRVVSVVGRDGRETRIEGFEKMDVIAERFGQIDTAKIQSTNSWLSI